MCNGILTFVGALTLTAGSIVASIAVVNLAFALTKLFTRMADVEAEMKRKASNFKLEDFKDDINFQVRKLDMEVETLKSLDAKEKKYTSRPLRSR